MISRRQFTAVAFCALFSPAIRTIPTLIVHISGEHAYLSVLMSIIPLLALGAFLVGFLRSLGPGEGMGEVFIRALGRPLGRGLLIIFGLWMLFYCAFVMRVSAHRFISTIFPTASPLAFIPAMGLLTLMLSLGSFAALGRLSALLRPIFTFTLLGVLLLCLPQIGHYTYSLPVPEELPELILGTLPVLNALSIWGYLSFMEGQVEGGPPRLGQFVPTLLGTVGLLGLLCYTTVGSFGDKLADKLSNPFFVMIRNLRVFTALERVEALVIALWFFTDLILIGAIIKAAITVLVRGLGVYKDRSKKILSAMSALAPAALALWLVPTATDVADLSMLIIPAVNMMFMFVLLPAVLLVGAVRKRV